MEIAKIIEIIANVATAFAIFVAVYEAKLTSRQYKFEKEHDKKKDTLDAYNHLQEETFDILYVKYSPSKIQEIVQNRRKKEFYEEYKELGTYVARIEHFCVGVVLEIYDWRTVYELSHGFLDGSIKRRIDPVIEFKESFAEDDPYENIRKVYQMMSEETNERKREKE